MVQPYVGRADFGELSRVASLPFADNGRRTVPVRRKRRRFVFADWAVVFGDVRSCLRNHLQLRVSANDSRPLLGRDMIAVIHGPVFRTRNVRAQLMNCSPLFRHWSSGTLSALNTTRPTSSAFRLELLKDVPSRTRPAYCPTRCPSAVIASDCRSAIA